MTFILRLRRVARRIVSSRRAGLLTVAVLAAISLVGNTLTYVVFDHATWGDGLWYSIISVTTIGYGDESAVSLGARLGTVFFIVFLGLSVFTVLLGMFADYVMERTQKGIRGMGTVLTNDHVVIANYAGASRLNQVLRELAGDPAYGAAPVVLVTDQIAEMPAGPRNLQFVNGSPLDDATWQRAGLADARLVLVLPYNYEDPNADAVSASIVSVIQRLVPGKRVVAECLDETRRALFPTEEAVSVVCGLQVAGNILVQELSDPGVSHTLEEITSNLRGTTLYSTRVADAPTVDYTTIAKALLDHGDNLLSVIRGTQTHTTFAGLRPQQGDVLVYVGEKRLAWQELCAAL